MTMVVHRPAAGREAGYSLIDALFVVSIVSMCIPLALPDPLEERRRTEQAGRQLAAVVHRLRAEAARRGVNVALVFRPSGTDFEFRPHTDGNGDGVKIADVRAGIDPPLAPVTTLSEFARGAHFGIPRAVPDPAGTGMLTPGGTPIRLGGTTILSFAPTGNASSGTVYLHGEQGSLYAVRVLGATGRVRLLRFDDRHATWIQP